jgi:hypothetical protein
LEKKMDRRSFLRAASVAAAAGPLLQEMGNASVHAKEMHSPAPAEKQCPDNAAGEEYILLPHIGLAGTWVFRLDPSSLGINERWFDRSLGEERIFLPGSTDQAGYGEKTSGPAAGHLSRPYTYTGMAWYQKELTIPETWQGRHITLFLERCHWQTSVWIDGVSYGSQNSLSVPHLYDFGISLAPGKHTLTLCVDNTIRIDVGSSAHSITESTQTNWNGIVGKIELRSTPAVWIDKVRVFTDAHSRSVKLEILLGNALTVPASGEIEAELRGCCMPARVPVPSFAGTKLLTLTLPWPASPRLWDDIDPNLYVVNLCARTSAGERVFEHRISSRFGIRDFSARDRQFLINGRPVLLRGTVENAVFPLTAYPPVEFEDWRHIFQTLRSYGMNHLRFHSWCPPEAAFAAADEAGVLLQVELPVFSHHVGTTPGLKDFMRQEGHRIIETYGNHPSFFLLCMGNELTGDFAFLDQLVGELKQADGRRLYTYSTNNGRPAPGPTSDYWVTEETAEGRLRIDKTRFGAKPGGTDYDFSTAIAAFNLPVVAHELGQWTVYPNYDEIAKYIGVLKPRNLEVFREQLAARDMADQAEAFQAASGRFAVEVYKEEIESALRTPKLGGFQLLELTDYPGQQEALVGLLDCFWESKHVTSPEAFRRFCGDTIPLCRFSKFVWTSEETFHAVAQVAHYGNRPLRQLPVTWSIADNSGRTLKSGTLRPCTVMPGNIAPLGEIAFPLSFLQKAACLTLTLQVGASIVNRWKIWVYPGKLPLPHPENVLLTSRFDDSAIQRLEAGGTVFLCAPPQQQADHRLKLRFLPVFWSLAMFKKQPGVLGILCDPEHPALASFPTEIHSNWQWWELTEGTNAFILDDMPAGLRPLIQVIDDFHRNHKLGLVFEARVGKGRLLATSLTLDESLDGNPVKRQLFYALLTYASGSDFKPQTVLDIDAIRQLFPAAG